MYSDCCSCDWCEAAACDDFNFLLASVFGLPAGGILQQSWQENLLELEAQLARSTAQWKLVIGHHPVRRNNRPDNNMDLLPTLEPILMKYGVQAYFCGHEHNLQYMHQQDSSVHYVISGGGSLTDYTPIVHYDNGGSQFQYWGSGESVHDSTVEQALCNQRSFVSASIVCHLLIACLVVVHHQCMISFCCMLMMCNCHPVMQMYPHD